MRRRPSYSPAPITDRLLAIYDADHHAYAAEAYAIAKNELNARDDIFTEDTLAWVAAMDDRWDEARVHMERADAYTPPLPMTRVPKWPGSDGRWNKSYGVYEYLAASRGKDERMIGGFGPRALGRVFDDSPGETRSKIVAIYALLIAANIGAWVLAFAAFSGRPVLLGTALLAYTFGLRHAVDADHISAIDNVTRKLMNDGKKPVSVGFFFSLGHSTIVVALSAAIAFAATIVHQSMPGLEKIGGVLGTSISAFFLYAIAAINFVVLLQVYRTFRHVRSGGAYSHEHVDGMLNQRGFWCRLFGPMMRSIGSSWHMYPLGVLFGLGFDTATEVGILGIAALEAGKGVPVAAIMIFPLLFTVGMCLLDTTDGVLMLGCYGWAFMKPIRKLYYNMNITLISVLVAVLVGTIELLSIIGPQLGFKGILWDGVARVSDNFGMIGVAIIGIFVVSWFVSTAVYKLRRYDEFEAAVTPGP
jgi:high-affinity nickel-transport protein